MGKNTWCAWCTHGMVHALTNDEWMQDLCDDDLSWLALLMVSQTSSSVQKCGVPALLLSTVLLYCCCTDGNV